MGLCCSTKKQKKELTIEDFEILKVIGQGQSSKVYLVQNKEDEEYFAMKSIPKTFIKDQNQFERLQTERDALINLNSPFIVNLWHAFQTNEYLCFILDFVNGGEMYTYLNSRSQFSENRIKLYAAEIILALKNIHELGLVYRDLKPENLLIDKNGHIRLTDFGISKFIATQKANSFCGSLEYIAPEVWQHDSYGIEVDFWCLGTVIYEMKYKMPPFYSTNLREMQNKILNGNPKFDENCSVELHDLIQKLLTKDPKQRLGTKSIREIMEHTFFSDLDWEKVEKQEIIPEFIPQVKDSSDTSCIDSQFLNQPIFEFHILPDIVKMDQNMFSGFSFSKFK